MKKILFGIIMMFMLVLNVQAQGVKPKDLRYYNKDIGIAIDFPTEWDIYTEDNKNVPDSFKEALKNKKDKNDSPLLLGMKKNQNAFVRLLIEKYNATLDEYMQLFQLMLDNPNINVVSITYSGDNNNATVIYQAKVNNLPIRFVDYVVMNNGYAVRLTFWSIDSLFQNQFSEFSEIAQKALFYDKSAKTNWGPLWASVPSSCEHDKKPVEQNNFKYMFFTVKSKTNTVYIMGSIHIGKDSFYPFPNNIETAFAKTNNIVVEVNTQSKEVKDKTYDFNSYAYLPNNKTLQDVLTKDLYSAVETSFLNYGVPMSKMNRFKPWVAAATLTTLKMMSLGYVANSGTENYFLAKAGDKKIFELESFEEQVKIFDSIDGNSFLAMTLLSLSSMEKELETMIDSWRNQDLQKLEDITMEGIENEGRRDYFEKFYFQRNLAMTDKIKGYLSQNEDYFVIVGSGHLVGEKGIVALLKKAGYTVE